MIDSKNNCIKSYNEQGYRTLEIPINPEDPKALKRKGWDKEPTNTNIGEDNLYAVVQEDNKLVFDIDDINFNEILNSYLDKTLVTQTGNGGRHYYFKDITRVKPIKSTKLYKDGKIIGDIKAHMSYVIGCGCNYQNEGLTKTYKKISSVNEVLEVNVEEILSILKEKGITTKINKSKSRGKKLELKEGDRNNGCFKTACKLFQKEEYGFEDGLEFIRTMNKLSPNPLDDDELLTTVKSAWKTTIEKPLDFEGKDKIDNMAKTLMEKYVFVTPRNTEKILLYNGKIYDDLQAESIIKEESNQTIPNCTKHEREEVIDKIKVQTYQDLKDFDNDPNLITLENGILNIEEERLSNHTPHNLSKVLLPMEYHKPKHPINEKTIFEDIEKNLKDTLFWKYLTNSFTVNGVLRRGDLETVLEIMASVFVKRQIDEKAFMFLGGGENGKSVCLQYIEALLGGDEVNVKHIPIHAIGEDKFACAELDGKSANIFSDLEDNELRHTGVWKDIVSGEGIQVQRKHGHPFTLYPFCKMIFSCNRFPKVFDQSQGFFRRWIIVKWDRNFERDSARIPNLKEKLVENQEEKNLVFSCLIPLSNKLNRTGTFSHAVTWKMNQRLWNENAEPLNSFIENYIIEDDSDKARKTKIETYRFYKNTMFDLGEIPLTMGKFGMAFKEMFEELKIDGVRYWGNIDFRLPKQEKLKSVDATKEKKQ